MERPVDFQAERERESYRRREMEAWEKGCGGGREEEKTEW